MSLRRAGRRMVPRRRAMTAIREMLRRLVAGSALAVAVLFIGAVGAQAQDRNLEQQILKALTAKPASKPLTRGLTAGPADTANRKFLETVKGRTTRSLTFDERERIADLAKEKPSIDVEINFDYGSAKIGPAAVPALTALGNALSNDDLKGSTFVIAGHTDGVGSEPYNQDLSEQRADAIKRYLIEHFRIPAASLVTVGYGKTKLKNEGSPAAPENRRAQIANME
jgi:outer membrane protein OmpA-like peptidoglycan-associated protein